MKRAVILFIAFILYYIGLCFISIITAFTFVFSVTGSVIILIFSIIGIVKKHYYFIITLILSIAYVAFLAFGMFHELFIQSF